MGRFQPAQRPRLTLELPLCRKKHFVPSSHASSSAPPTSPLHNFASEAPLVGFAGTSAAELPTQNLPMLLLPPPTLFIAFARTWWNVASDHKLGSLIMPILGIWMHLMESAYPVLLLWCASKLWAPYWKEVVPKFAGLHIASAHLCTWCLWKVKFAREGTIGPHQAA